LLRHSIFAIFSSCFRKCKFASKPAGCIAGNQAEEADYSDEADEAKEASSDPSCRPWPDSDEKSQLREKSRRKCLFIWV